MRSKPFTPEERFLKWTNFVLEHGKIEELQIEGNRLTFIEYFCLDVIGLGIIFLFLFIYLTYRFMKFLYFTFAKH